MERIETGRLAMVGNDQNTQFDICQKPDNRAIGWVILGRTNGEIAVRIAPEFRGRGYGAEAARAAVWHAFEQLDLDMVFARPEAGCAAAERLLDSLGFVRAGDGWRLYHTDRLPGSEWNWSAVARPEPMGAFFDVRADGYDEHMFSFGGGEAYAKLGACVPQTDAPIEILDIGCGTGIELDYIWNSAPNARITCVDLSRGMLELLLRNHADRRGQIAAVEASYVDWDYPEATFDIAISSQTMHHFFEAEKVAVYRRIWGCLKPGGSYIESDFIVDEPCAEQYRRRYGWIASGLGRAPGTGEFHIDIPFTIETQERLLREAGFRAVEVAHDGVKPRWSAAILRAAR